MSSISSTLSRTNKGSKAKVALPTINPTTKDLSQLHKEHHTKYIINNPFRKYFKEIYPNPNHPKHLSRPNQSPEYISQFKKLFNHYLNQALVSHSLTIKGTPKQRPTLCWTCKHSKSEECPLKAQLAQDYENDCVCSTEFTPTTNWAVTFSKPENTYTSCCVHICPNYSIMDINRRNGWLVSELYPLASGFMGLTQRTFARGADRHMAEFNKVFGTNIQLRDFQEDEEIEAEMRAEAELLKGVTQ